MEPLASLMRPQKLEDFVGQPHLTGKDGTIAKLLDSNRLPSMIFWGPPGTGKTTLAGIISKDMRYDYYRLQAVSAGKAKLKSVIEIAERNREYNKKTILFLDEIHRWNKAQQDALLPFVEQGIITLIGATTENPSFNINNALLSRSKVFIFKPQSEENILKLLKKAVKEELNNKEVKIEDEALELIAGYAGGDIRTAYNTLEIAHQMAKSSKQPLDKEILKKTFQKQLHHDKKGENHYNIISAVHKSMRSSDPDASAYWITRMLEGGDDPLYVARRLLRFASEDIGNADSNAVILANAVFDTCQKLGMPECAVHLVQLGIYLAKAPKDNSAYTTYKNAKSDVEKYGNLPVPLHLRNAPTEFMKKIGYGKGYQYDHDVKGKKSGQQCMPDKLKDRKYLN
jgi:putative ATPase